MSKNALPILEARLQKRAVEIFAGEHCRWPVIKRVLGSMGGTGTFRLYDRGWRFGKHIDIGFSVYFGIEDDLRRR